VSSLTTQHDSRIKQDVEFGYIYQDIAEFKKHHEDKTISLVETERLASRSDDDKRILDRTNERRVKNGLAVVASLDDVEDETATETEVPDPFLNETAYITLDLVDASKVANNSVK
jgi:carboxyl-terminal processing protease